MAFKLKTGTVASAARTATGQSAAITVTELGGQLSVFVDVTAASGTSPTLGVTVQWSHDGTTWFNGDPVDAFTSITAAGSVIKLFTVKAPIYRIGWTIGGTGPSFTFQTHEYITSL